MLKLWYEYETEKTQASQLVRQMNKLKCIDQTIIYEKRSKLNLREFMTLKEQITLSELKSWLKLRLQNYENLKLKKKTNITVMFVFDMMN